MPFRKVGTDNYVSPSGRHFDSAQVRLYYANGGKFPGQKTKEASVSKFGSKPQSANYAAGGPVLGRTRDFLKEPVPFRTDKETQDYGKKGAGEKGKDKSLNAIKPQK